MQQSRKSKENIALMFDQIADEYDATGHVLSLGIDRLWRKRIRKIIARNHPSPLQILDLAAGTGDLSLVLSKIPQSTIVGLDISEKMLECARQKVENRKVGNIRLMLADALHIPFPDDTFDIVTVAFGIRNYEDFPAGIREIHRVLKPNGRYYILELTRPKAIIRPFYLLYLHWVLPAIGSLLTRRKNAYTYLTDSICDFKQDDVLNACFLDAGFKDCSYRHWSLGIATLYSGQKKYEKQSISAKNDRISTIFAEDAFLSNEKNG